MDTLFQRFILPLIFTFFATSVMAQQQAEINLGLYLELEQIEDAGKTIHFLVKGDLDAIRRTVEWEGGQYKFGVNDIASVSLPLGKVGRLAAAEGVERLEYNPSKGQVLSDFLRENNNLDSVHQGLGDLPLPLTGQDVVVGIIDSGIDWEHPDFQNPDGTTRILYIWDQLVLDSTNMQATFDYGYEWTKADMDAGICQHNPNVEFGHGTGAAGMAAGNGAVVGKYAGAAPDADIIHVSIDLGDSFQTNFVDAVSYIFQKATDLGKPCVINSSVGSYRGPHDDRGLEVQLVENLLEAQNGRALVQAAGNGALPISNNSCNYWHLGYPVTADTSVTFFRYTNVIGMVFFDMYADTADFNNVYFSMGPRDRNTLEDKGQSRWFNIPTDLDLSITTVGTIYDTVYYNNNIYGIVRIDVERDGGVYEMLFRVLNSVSSDYWEFHTTGSGTFDVWSSRQLIGTSKISRCELPTPAELPIMANYQYPDTIKTIVSSWACSDKVITVANYSNLDGYDYYGGGYFENSVPRDVLVFDSSTGPTRKGRQKPDIGASGNFTMTTAVLELLEDLKINNPSKVATEGWHAAYAGTSAASPVVAGTVACYFQLFPDADWEEVKDKLIASAKVDSFVLLKGPAPNYGFGHGKLDGFRFINEAIVLGCTDPEAPNFDPSANVDDGTCTLVGIEDVSSEVQLLEAIPNPANQSTLIRYALKNERPTHLDLTDLQGKVIKRYQLDQQSGEFRMEIGDLPAGLYLYSLRQSDRVFKTRKLIVY